eukprot:SAG31_NODE_32187_length_359_cov_0.588462_1_plen_115_part_01
MSIEIFSAEVTGKLVDVTVDIKSESGRRVGRDTSFAVNNQTTDGSEGFEAIFMPDATGRLLAEHKTPIADARLLATQEMEKNRPYKVGLYCCYSLFEAIFFSRRLLIDRGNQQVT